MRERVHRPEREDAVLSALTLPVVGRSYRHKLFAEHAPMVRTVARIKNGFVFFMESLEDNEPCPVQHFASIYEEAPT